MKKLLSLVLALLTVLAVMPFSTVSAAENDPITVFGPLNLDTHQLIGSTGLAFSVVVDGDDIYYRGVAQPGQYDNNGLICTFAAIEFDIINYPYIKFSYRSNSVSPKIDISSNSSVGESWMNSHPVMQGDGQWHEVVINLKDITGGGGPIPDGDKTAFLRIKPFNSGNVTLAVETYFDLQYIACFKTEAEAKAFKYTGETEVAEMKYDAEYFYEEATDEIIQKYMDETDDLIEEIENTPTDVEVTGTKYYVSSSTGSDHNDGLTPETAWKTASKASNFSGYKDGDGVFFKRGDTWRTTSTFKAYSGVTYSAYGEGAKPKLLGSIDASDTSMWIPTEYENIYAFTTPIDGTNGDVGTIVFDGGRAWGIHVQGKTNGQRLDNGTVFNGLESYTIPVGEFRGHQDLKGNLEFYHDWDTETLYLYCEGGNPAEVFSSIEVADKGNGIGLQNDSAVGSAHDIVIDNIEIVGFGSHGIGAGNVKNVTVQNCVLKWIGGSIQGKGLFGRDYGVRFGNAVESYGSSDNFIIRYCYASQIYDCCWTVQRQEAAVMNNIQMYKNVSEYCNTGLEVWQSGGSITNMQLHDNYTRFNGYGFSHQRPSKDGNFFYGATSTNCTYENNDVYNNVGLFASRQVLSCGATGTEHYNFHDNIYIMENDKLVGGVTSQPGLSRGAMTNMKYTEQNIARASQSGFEKGTKFYYTEPSPYENMYAICLPQNGVNVFEDISDDFWGRDAVDFVSLKGLFNGVSATEFAPNGSMTRAMLVTVLSRIAGDSGKSKTDFADVSANAWYAPAVGWAEENSIVEKETSFRPDDKATREEMAYMLMKYADMLYVKYDLSGAKSFSDFESVDAKYQDAIKFCTVNGIIGGYEDGTIRPKNGATRAEVATMIKRFIGYV
ncbi:MAG: S-layer homology domain-containing protein, partial [Clostridia bacterium]|nr:S-layer homology domain-containing protein [Clostridia bacterium]